MLLEHAHRRQGFKAIFVCSGLVAVSGIYLSRLERITNRVPGMMQSPPLQP